MKEMQWVNTTTREAYFHFLETVADPLDFAKGWIEMHGRESLRQLSRRLARDFKAEFAGTWSDRLHGAAFHAGFRTIAWVQVASRILERAGAPHLGMASDQKDQGDECGQA